MAVKFKLENYTDIHKQLQRIEKQSDVAMKRIMSDTRNRTPDWIAAEAVKRYGLSKKEFSGGKLGSIKVKGDSLESVEITYTGKLLTPYHFNMKPKEPPSGSYTLKATILRGQRKTLGNPKKLTKKQRSKLAKNLTRSGTQESEKSPMMLMYTGNKKEDGINYIPFRRRSKNRKDIVPIKTVSIPQMVSHDGQTLKPEIAEVVNEKLQKRIEHHTKFLNR